MKRGFILPLLLWAGNATAQSVFLECAIKGTSFDTKFEENIAVKIENGMMDVVSEEFPLFAKVEEAGTSYKAVKSFVSQKGVKYFFNVEIDRVSGRFMAYETSALQNRKIYNTTGVGPCVKVSELQFSQFKAESKKSPPVKVIIRKPD